MINDKIISTTEIEGLRFEENLYTAMGDKYFHVISSSGPCVSDLVTHSANFKYDQYGIHIGQVDRLTFFGDRNQKITGYFVDCRKGSPTLRKQVILEFYPDPTKKLFIDRGIAHTFDGIENVLTRDEPVWYMSVGNPDYNIANDVINVHRSIKIEDFPTVQINDLPIPRKAYEIVLQIQHHSFSSARRRYSNRVKVKIGGEERYVLLTPKDEE